MTGVYKTICNRRSIRRFKQDPISIEILRKIVNAGRLAPSGANIQPCEFIIVDASKKVNAIFPHLKWAGYIAPAGNPQKGEQPVAYIAVLVDLHQKKKGGDVDAAAAIQNMLLAAWDQGIGSCWLGAIDRKAIKKVLRVPHHLNLNSVIALGYPNENPVVEEAGESIKYWKDEKNVLHVPKRKMQDITHLNQFGDRVID